MRIWALALGGCALACILFAGCGQVTSPVDSEGMARLVRHVEFLSSKIGPRPAGTAADRAARDYIVREMEGSGLEVRQEEFRRVPLTAGTQVTLSSGNVIGTLKGDSGGAILLGAHHDSRDRSCPGASDDASGVAVVLEAARILASRPRRHTLIFASFGGEETFGFPGSRVFVRNWKGDPIRLAVTLDFVGSGRLFVAPFPTPPGLWANRLLRRAEREARTGRVTFDPWLAIVPRLLPVGFGADHESFLESGVPALNLSCEFPGWSYHTAEDRPERVDPGTLLAARNLAVGILSDADGRESFAAESDRAYLPLTVFGFPLFLRGAALWALGGMVGLLGLVSVVLLRREGASWSAAREGIRSVLVSLLLTALAVSGPFVVEKAFQRARRLQNPGWAHPVLFLTVAVLAGAFTLWLAFRLARFLRPSNLSGAYLLPAILLEGAMAGACLARGLPDLAFPFLAGTGAMLLAAWSRYATRRLAWGFLGIAALLPFLSPSTYRLFLELSGVTVPPFALELAAGILFLPWFLFFQHLACLPEALYARPGGLLFRPLAGLGLALAALGGAGVAALRPSYDAGHRVLVSVREEIDLQRHRAEAAFSSLETLGRVRLNGLGDRSLPGREEAQVRVPFPPLDLPGLRLEPEEAPGNGEILVRVRGTPPGDPRRVALRFGSGKRVEVEREGRWESAEECREILFPAGGSLDEVVHLRWDRREPLLLAGDISYDSDFLNLRPEAPFTTFRFETRVHFERRFP